MASGGPGSTGPSGRSPYPPTRQHRTRAAAARMSLGENSAVDESASHSPFLHGLLRFSPSNSAWSPHNRSNRSKTRFFDHQNNTTTTNANAANENNDNDDEEMDNEAAMKDGIPIQHLRSLATQALLESPSQAAFYASLLYSKTGKPHDALLLAQANLSSAQYSACLRILEESNLLQSDYPWEALLLACAALAAANEWSSLVELLEDACRLPAGSNNNPSTNTTTFRSLAISQPLDDDDEIGWESLKRSIVWTADEGYIHPLARICDWRGRAYNETGHGIRASLYWKRALKMDCQCQQAWEALLERNLLTPAQAYQLIQNLEFPAQMDWLRSLYLARIELSPQDRVLSEGGSKAAAATTPSFALHGTNLDASSIQLSSPVVNFQTPAGSVNLNSTTDDTTVARSSPIQAEVDAAFEKLWNEHKLQNSPQVLAMAARRAFRRYEWKDALSYCQALAQFDPNLSDAAFCYVATLVVMGHKRVLFRLGHEWVDADPKSAQAWFAVGSYYYCCERHHIAQRHFCRATRLDPQCSEAWIAFGCSFAACDESDQALASFRAAQRLSPGEHTSLLYMGMEYVRTNHLALAHYFLQSALSASGGDPLCLHELGVLAAQKGEHMASIPWFQRALVAAVGGDNTEESIERCQDPYWEPTIFNLGHAYRKTRKFEKAAQCFRRCVALCPEKFSTYAALAFTYHLVPDLDKAIDYYHQALSCKPDDPFSTEMLNRALREALTSTLRLSDGVPTIGKKSLRADRPLFMSPHSDMSGKDDSMMSEDMESDVDMGAM